MSTISPSVTSTEINKPYYIPNYTNEIAAFVGYFEKGPINEPVFITDVNQFKMIFGRGIDMYHNDWYQVYNYLQYSTGIWVCRASGSHKWNASSVQRTTILDLEDYESKKDTLPINEYNVNIIAKTPGEFGNLLSYSFITKNEWDLNVQINEIYKAKDLFTYFEENYGGFCIFRKGRLVEKYYLNNEELNELSKSNYVYVKYNNPLDFIPCYGDSIQILKDGSTNLSTDDDLNDGYELFKNKSLYDIDIIIGNELDNNLAIDVAETRRDCLAFVGIPVDLVNYLKVDMGESPAEVLYTEFGVPLAIIGHKQPKKFDTMNNKRLLNYLNTITKSQFCHFTGNIKEQYDGFTNTMKRINFAGDAAGLKSAASLSSPWAPGAGLERGIIKNMNDIHMYFDKDVQDKYYKLGLNFIENGRLISQKTFTIQENGFNRVNIRSLFNHIEKIVEFNVRKYLFEENTLNVRRNISFEIKQILTDAKSKRGLDGAKVYVHPDENDSKSIIVDVQIKPTHMTEYINLRIKNVGTDIISQTL